LFGALTLLLLATIIIGIAVGSTYIPPLTVGRVLLAHLLPGDWAQPFIVRDAADVVVWMVRTPRVLVAVIVGAALAIAGAQMQGLFQNPMASPDVIATSGGAALGAVLTVSAGLAAQSLFWLPFVSFIGALASLVFIYVVTTRRGRTPVAMLLLAGVALNALLGSVTQFVLASNWNRYEVAQEIVFWLMGGLASRTWTHVWLCAPLVLIGIAASMVFTRELDLLLVGEESAQSLGVEVERVKRITLVTAALLTGSAVAVSGIIGFVGLIVPHAVRLLVGPSHKRLLPAAGLVGGAFLVVADLAARTLLRPEEISLGIVTASFGAPFFLYLLIRHRREVGYL